MCGFCESWYHGKCIDGLTAEFLDCIDKLNRMHGAGSAFLCAVCRKMVGKINHSFQDLEKRLNAVELELKATRTKADKTEEKTKQVKDKVVEMEKEVESGMTKAKKEAIEEMKTEMTEREEKSTNVVVYGLAEATTDDTKARKDHDAKKMRELMTEIGIGANDEAEVLYRAGKKQPDKVRPMVVRVANDDTRENIFRNARKLARSPGDEWHRVFVSADLTWQQREEARKKEKELRDEATKKSEEAKNGGKTGKFVVIGQRGKNRRVVWRDEKPEAA